ncbi:hypothetical protein F5B18DRAFT_153769 [Nemania serpens]|nr:hypothetical protein F5B18DRAFT_153769 [Nemania serpens]
MSDPTTASPAVVPPSPPASDPEGRRFSTATLPANDNAGPSSVTASAGSPPYPPSRYPPSAHSSISKAPPSVSGSRVTATSPPTTVSGGPGPASAHSSVPESGGTSTATMSLSLDHSLSSRDSQLHVAEARAALVASMSNMLDSELQSRASLLHANSVALSRQERDVAKATDGLRKENDKLAKVVRDAGRKIKELGNVQNWAEVLERDFMVLEETMRLVRGGADSDDDESSCSECSGSYWSGSESERDLEGEGEEGGTRLGSLAVSRKGSVSEVREQQGDREGKMDVAKGRDKGKSLDSGSGSSTAVGGGSTISNASRADSASNLSGSTHATVSLDQAILESLAEAMATDMRIGLTTTAA